MPTHQQVKIEWGDHSAEVDAGLSELLLALWHRGYHTSTSCEAQEGTAVNDAGRVVPVAWIGFVTLAEAERFTDAIGFGELLLPEPGDYGGLTDAEIAANPEQAVGVAFPSTRIQAALAAIRAE